MAVPWATRECLMAANNVYDSLRMATGYAFDRPPVHQHVIRVIGERLRLNRRDTRALDVGCGAGLSTAALEPLAHSAVGVEPVPNMLRHARAVAPHAAFVVGQAERLPFQAGTFDLVTAAGSLNYVDLALFLPDVARVLVPGGVLAIYDFSAGRRLCDSAALDTWYATFECRYPPKPGYDLDVRGLAYAPSGLRLDAYEEFEVAVPMTLGSYLPYAMSETGVEMAIARGVADTAIRNWCESTLGGVLDDTPTDVIFDAYVAYVRR
jgi:SAM-dependent methyltransferase